MARAKGVDVSSCQPNVNYSKLAAGGFDFRPSPADTGVGRRADEGRCDVKERPIIFTGESVRSIFAGTKTQTRRIAKFVPRDGANLAFSGMSAGHFDTGVPSSGHVLYSRGRGGVWQQRTEPLHCPHGAPGDRLYVKETHRFEVFSNERFYNDADGYSRSTETIDVASDPGDRVWYEADGDPPKNLEGWTSKRSPLYMPRWASRLTLEIVDVRVQRLNDISEEDARAEGVDAWINSFKGGDTYHQNSLLGAYPTTAFARMWDAINGKRHPWASNPWVWAITFRRVA